MCSKKKKLNDKYLPYFAKSHKFYNKNKKREKKYNDSVLKIFLKKLFIRDGN